MTMISRTGSDTGKDLLNPSLRNFDTYADFLVDLGRTTQLGADGANASAVYFQGDHIHPSQFAEWNIIEPLVGLGYNRYYGKRNLTTANTYTSAAAPAVATTGGSESTNTITITFAGANLCLADIFCTCTRITPAGYNGTWFPRTRQQPRKW